MYLKVDEQATYIDIFCDGYVVRVHSDGSDAYLGEILDPNNLSTAWQRFGSKVDVGGTIYALSEDTGIAVTLIENTPMRVVIKAAGDFETSAQASLTNESASELWLFIYPDKMVQHVKFNATGSITLADSTDNGICFMDSVVANIAAEDSKYEATGTETDAGSDGEQNTADYIATLSTEINIAGVMLENAVTGTATYGQYIDDPGVALRFEWNDGTVTALSTMTVAWLVDSADRENDGGTFLDWDSDIDGNAVTVGTICEQSADSLRYFCHTAHTAGAGNEPPNASYWHEYRMTLGNQYKDLVMAAPTTGSEVIDLAIPKNVAPKPDTSTDDFVNGATAAGGILEDCEMLTIFNEGTGAPTDLMSNWTLTNNGADWLDSNDPSEGLDFVSGNNDYISLGTGTIGLTDKLTLLAWVTPHSTEDDGRLISKHVSGNYGFLLTAKDIGVSDRAEWRISTDGSNWTGGNTSNNTMPENDSTMVVATYDGTNMRIYFDAVEETVTTFPRARAGNVNDSSQDLQIGRDAFSGDASSLDGEMYALVMWSRALSATEISRLYNDFYGEIFGSGFAADGARHAEMAAEVLAYTADTTRIGHVDVIHDPMITTDGSTDRVIEHIKADDNAASATIVATIGSNGNWETLENANRNTSNDSISTDIDRGTGLDTVDTYMIDHNVSVYDNAYFKQGTKIISFTPQFSYNDAADQTIWSLYVDAGDYIQITYDAGNDRYELRVSWGGTLTTLNGAAYTDDVSLQQLTCIQAAWDSDEDFCQLVINGQVVDNGTNTGTPSASGAAYVMTGADCVTDADGTGQLPADIYIGDSKAIDGCLLPYGAHYTGPGAVDTDLADEDILFLWQGADATPIGSDVTNDGGDYATAGPIGTNAFDNSDAGDNASAATSGNISAAEGSLSFWFKPNSALGADCTLFYADAAFKIWWDDSDNDLVFTYNTDVLNMTTAFAAGDTNWHHVCCQWKASDSLFIIVDGLETSLLTGVDAAPTLDANMYFTADDADGTNRADVLMSDFFITDKMGTPQIPVVLGSGPIYAPIREVT